MAGFQKSPAITNGIEPGNGLILFVMAETEKEIFYLVEKDAWKMVSTK